MNVQRSPRFREAQEKPAGQVHVVTRWRNLVRDGRESLIGPIRAAPDCLPSGISRMFRVCSPHEQNFSLP
ncbi:hypothetical protein NITMOv2_3207 [Nitrospira moscoviensis]|uniref:Uncharacterized protein n=1 Tax=Nitrospira moscoviensis TaxID=42253 RepID=A0A0K2GF77_NITMO|nr:hypothetical protein NITMOv2_3207 [Nitrospira moscoviensis]